MFIDLVIRAYEMMQPFKDSRKMPDFMEHGGQIQIRGNGVMTLSLNNNEFKI